MRAITISSYGDPSVLHLSEAEKPRPARDEVLIAVRAAAINPVDAKIRTGSQRAIIHLDFPAILGMDLAGDVIALGRDVKDFVVGDKVYGSPNHKRMGSYAEFAAVKASELAKMPTSSSYVEAASLPLAVLTAWDSLVRHGRIEKGMRVLIQAGAGGVGSLAIQLAKHFGATVYATSSSRNLELLRELGADVPIDYTKEKYDEVAKDCDLVVDSLGPEHFERTLAMVKKGGTIIGLTAGIPEAVEKHGVVFGMIAAIWTLAAFLIKARLTKGVRFLPITRKPDGKILAQIARLVDDGDLKAIIDTVLPLEDARKAHELSEGGRSRGKVVLEMSH